MPKFILEIDTDNEAMVYPCQIARALNAIAGKITDESMYNLKKSGRISIRDSNGNTVGSYKVVE